MRNDEKNIPGYDGSSLQSRKGSKTPLFHNPRRYPLRLFRLVVRSAGGRCSDFPCNTHVHGDRARPVRCQLLTNNEGK